MMEQELDLLEKVKQEQEVEQQEILYLFINVKSHQLI